MTSKSVWPHSLLKVPTYAFSPAGAWGMASVEESENSALSFILIVNFNEEWEHTSSDSRLLLIIIQTSKSRGDCGKLW